MATSEHHLEKEFEEALLSRLQSMNDAQKICMIRLADNAAFVIRMSKNTERTSGIGTIVDIFLEALTRYLRSDEIERLLDGRMP